MKDRIKYILIGIVVGIIIGMGMFYLLINFRIIRPYGFDGIRQFPRSDNFTNFTRPPRGA